MKNSTRILLLSLLLVCGIPLQAQIAKSCVSAFRLTNDEAKILLYMTPTAIAARRAGTDVDIEPSKPTQQYPAADFFLATLVSQKPIRGSVLGNGILGAFVVDKRTGEVYFMGDFKLVQGKVLDRVRGWLLHSHCRDQ